MFKVTSCKEEVGRHNVLPRFVVSVALLRSFYAEKSRYIRMIAPVLPVKPNQVLLICDMWTKFCVVGVVTYCVCRQAILSGRRVLRNLGKLFFVFGWSCLRAAIPASADPCSYVDKLSYPARLHIMLYPDCSISTCHCWLWGEIALDYCSVLWVDIGYCRMPVIVRFSSSGPVAR